MAFLTDENLTFHRFSDGSISIGGSRRPSADNNLDDNPKNNQFVISENKKSKNFQPAVWTTDNTSKNYPSENVTNNEFQFISPNENINKSLPQNGSTVKLLVDDQSSKQTKCSIFRGVILCLFLNITYANIVRFPRELERHGTEFLVPYFILLFLIGLPIVLLEMSVGQFLGQGSAQTWRASPFFKGASIVGRIASGLTSIWVSLQAAIAFTYVISLSWKTVPFCKFDKPLITETGYVDVIKSGQECLRDSFFLPVWENTLYFGMLAISLMAIWVISMFCTHNGKILRRSIFIFGFIALSLLIIETGWEVTKSVNDGYFPEMWPFNYNNFNDSTIWFNALVQVIFSTNIGIGALPVLSGKLLYKGDAVRTSVVYICFNVLISAITVTFYLTQFNNPTTMNSSVIFPELTTLTVIYDKAIWESDALISRIVSGISFVMIVASSIVTVAICLYTLTRMIKRHPTYSMCFCGLILSIIALLCPDYLVGRVLDSRITASLIICALIFDIIALVWVYGCKNLYTDLEFSIGRSIFKIWIGMWIIAPLALIGILLWWLITFMPINDITITYVPTWAPIVFSLAIIVIVSCMQVYKQVDYNFMSMIKESAKPSKNWGPADPLVRHAWKQWKSVCIDTGERDFTLRRRGTRDYTNSIKRGQYPHTKYGTNKRRQSTPGNSSPNYSGSLYNDSAIEEDMSEHKYQPQVTVLSHENMKKSPQIRKISQENGNHFLRPNSEEKFNISRVEITPPDAPNYRVSLIRNPMGRVDGNPDFMVPYTNDNFGNLARDSYIDNGDNEHICWRKFSVNSQEYSTEL